jgi:hypothetical protein
VAPSRARIAPISGVEFLAEVLDSHDDCTIVGFVIVDEKDLADRA